MWNRLIHVFFRSAVERSDSELVQKSWHTPLVNLVGGPNAMVLVKVVSDVSNYKTHNGFPARTFTVADESGPLQAHDFGNSQTYQKGDTISGTTCL